VGETPDHHPVHASAELPARLLRTALLFLIGFLVIRTALVEPFGVPTGSMAPTLLGNHREVACPRCGYPVIVGEMPSVNRRDPYANNTCPNCGQRGINLTASLDIPGDRLLVDKNVFSIRAPRRWEVAVFKCPVDDSTPYVKRVVGLPGERVQVLGGDVFINGELERKSFQQFQQMAVPVFDSTYEPESGWRARWVVESANPPRPVSNRELSDGTLILDATNGKPLTVAYHSINLDTLQEEPIRDLLVYNAGTGVGKPESVHDFSVSFDLKIVDSMGALSCTLTDGLSDVTLGLAMGSMEGLSLNTELGETHAEAFEFENASTHHFELLLFDRRAVLRRNGRILVTTDLPADPTNHGRRKSVASPFRFELSGGKVEITNIRLFRDVHYRTDGANGIDTPYQLGPTDYFVLGDNSANSRDSRVWKIPGVPRADFIGKPFLIHQPLHLGRVTLNGQERTYTTLDWSRLKWVR
jgi:signal peptidase I